MEENINIQKILQRLEQRIPFTFVRFSDGETEVLQERTLILGENNIHFKGQNINVGYPKYDVKTFLPNEQRDLINDLWSSLGYKSEDYFIGIPWKHNLEDDHKWYLDYVRGASFTNADLLVNSNYRFFRKKLVPTILTFENVYVVANHRAKDKFGLFNNIFSLGDDFFGNYEETKKDILRDLLTIEEGSVVLSSASSLSNILGYELRQSRNDVTFIDCGSSINYLIGLGSTRVYQWLAFGPRNLFQFKQCVVHILTGKYFMK